MPISFTDAFDVDKNLFNLTGAFDPILDVDSRLFIDPALLEITQEAEFKGSREEMEHFFSGIVSLLKRSTSSNDRFWKRADRELRFTEIKGTCLGYSKAGIDGNGIGSRLRNQVLSSIKELLDSGADDPILFELLGAFEEGIGSDRISDLLAYKLIDRICAYTERIISAVHFDGRRIEYHNYFLPASPYSTHAVLLLPKSILHPLPLAKKYEDIDAICRENERVRNCVNKWFDFSDGKHPTKSDIFYHLKNDVDFRNAYIMSYRDSVPVSYDYLKDPFGETFWYEQGKKLAENNPLTIDAGGSLESIVLQIVMRFKSLVETNGAWELLYKEDRTTPRKERSAQHLFSVVADSYCRANNIDISPEVNSGNGPVDFKFSYGYENKVLVELKLSSNSQLNHCLETQIPVYMRQEQTDKAVYLLLNVGNDKSVDRFHEKYSALDDEKKKKIGLVIVDAKPKQSASKA